MSTKSMRNRTTVAVDRCTWHTSSRRPSSYTITPTTPVGESADQMAASGKPNAFGIVPKVQQMQSEAGAAGGVHGTLSIGAMS